MTSIASSSLNSGVTGYATVAFGAGQQITRSLLDKVENISFVRNGVTLVAFDAVVQETHSIECQPTAFPVEDGSTISDHVIRTPRELSLQGIITDTPLRTKEVLLQEGIASAAGIVAGPLGVLAASQAQAFASSRALASTGSPSIANFQQILKMATGADGASPDPFVVKTSICDYPNMIIRSVQIPRDVTTGAALVFGITLTSMLVVSGLTVAAKQTSAPRQAIAKAREGEQQVSQVGKAYKEGANAVDIATGNNLRFSDAPAVYTGK